MRVRWQLVEDYVMDTLDRESTVEMEALRVEQEPLFTQKEAIPHLSQFTFRSVLTSLTEINLFFVKVITKSDVIVVRRNKDEGIAHKSVASILRQDLLGEKLKAILCRLSGTCCLESVEGLR